MRNISDTISRLSARQIRNGYQTRGGVRDRLADIASFGSNPGALRGRTYIPEDLPKAAPLVVVLHGCTQTAADYDHGSGWSNLADQDGFALLFPEQQRSNNPNLCFNWFVPSDARRDSGEALSIRQMIESIVVAHSLDRRRIFITGFSAGGAMTSVMLATYPEVFAGGAIIAGLAYGSARTIPEAFDRMRGHAGPPEQHLQKALRDASMHKGPWPTISVWHGSADQIVAPSNADAIVGQWLAVHGLDASPSRSEWVEGHERRVWCNNEGRALIEAYMVAGMAHGAPIAMEGVERLGTAAPFIIDAGISSTRRSAWFWEIAKSKGKFWATANPATEHVQELIVQPHIALDAQRGSTLASGSSAKIRNVIENALRSAGLMN